MSAPYGGGARPTAPGHGTLDGRAVIPTLLAAVDVAGGRAVQVVDGDDDPLRVALGWVAQGARWIHLVDLDRAYRRGSDLPLLTHLVAALPVPVQLSGGLDRPEVVDQALATGARRINLAVTALRDPGWVAGLLREHGDRVAVGIDVLGDRVVARGSGEDLGPVQEVVATARAAFLDERPGAYVVADARRDGRRTGADLRLFRGLVEALGAPVVASGGVATLADLVALRTVGVSGIVLGSALYHRAFTLTEALEVLG